MISTPTGGGGLPRVADRHAPDAGPWVEAPPGPCEPGRRAPRRRILRPCRCTSSTEPVPAVDRARRPRGVRRLGRRRDRRRRPCWTSWPTAGQPVARFDPDQLFDYRSRRPTLEIRDGRLSSLAWPEVTLTRSRASAAATCWSCRAPSPTTAGGCSPEPIVSSSSRASASRGWISLGAIPAAVPHTRPVPILGTESAPGLLRGGVTAGPTGHPPRPVGGAVDARDGGGRRRHPGGRLLRPDPALRQRPLRARRRSSCCGRSSATSTSSCRAATSPTRRAQLRHPPRRGGGGRRDDARLRRAAGVDGRRVAAARGRRPDRRDRALLRDQSDRRRRRAGDAPRVSSARAGRSPSGPGSSRRAAR